VQRVWWVGSTPVPVVTAVVSAARLTRERPPRRVPEEVD